MKRILHEDLEKVARLAPTNDRGLFIHLFSNLRNDGGILVLASQRIFGFQYIRQPDKGFGVPKNKYSWFGESWSRPLGPKAMKMMGFQVVPK